jgi:hypothetical protein
MINNDASINKNICGVLASNIYFSWSGTALLLKIITLITPYFSGCPMLFEPAPVVHAMVPIVSSIPKERVRGPA